MRRLTRRNSSRLRRVWRPLVAAAFVAGLPAKKDTDRPVRVLQATNPPNGTTRYIDQVVTHAPADVCFSYYSPRRLVLGRFDVVHFHWPESLVRHGSRLRNFRRKLVLLLAIARYRCTNVLVVRTFHNVEPHEPGSRLERWTLRQLDAATDHWVTINDVTAPPSAVSQTYIPHGHYRDRFASIPKSQPISGRIAFGGLVRAYKGVEELVSCFQQLEDPALTLRIVGRAKDPHADVIRSAVEHDARISLRLEFVPDEDLVGELSEAELICLPYRDLHNSGTLLVALSLDRPVLVPSTPTTESWASEMGADWIFRYEGELTSDILADALRRAREERASARPDLRGRDWTTVAESYASVFRLAASDR